jgi:hypothetical protein
MKSTHLLILLGSLLSSLALAGPEGWIKLQTSQKDFDLYYQPLSVQTEATGHVKVASLINYSSKNGSHESLFTETVYNCVDQKNLDLVTAQHEGHWAGGEVIAISKTNGTWRRVLPLSVGATLMATACMPPNSTQFQR